MREGRGEQQRVAQDRRPVRRNQWKYKPAALHNNPTTTDYTCFLRLAPSARSFTFTRNVLGVYLRSV